MEYGFWSTNRTGQPVAVPPFALAFSTEALYGHALAAADEEGVVTVLDTRRSLLEQMHASTRASSPVSRFVAHDNAIFDIIWMSSDRQVATASGDGTVRVFDIETMYRSALLRGHSGSAKAIRSIPGTNDNVVISTGRDGQVRAFDLRIPSVTDHDSREQYHAPIFTIDQPHSPPAQDRGVNCGSGGSRKRRRISALKPRSSHGASVTSLAFLPGSDTLLFTAGAADGCVKLWDLRSLGGGIGNNNKKSSQAMNARCVSKVTPCLEPRQQYGLPVARRTHGIAHVDVDEQGQHLLVASTDSCIYLYNARNVELGHTRVLTGHTATSFYIRAKFSPDGTHVISGSADAKAYVWDINARDKQLQGGGNCCGAGGIQPILALDGHTGGEASAVDWCRRDPLKIATCADDATAKVWTVTPGRKPGAPRDNINNLGDDNDNEECMARYVRPKVQTMGRKENNNLLTTAGGGKKNGDIRTYFRTRE